MVEDCNYLSPKNVLERGYNLKKFYSIVLFRKKNICIKEYWYSLILYTYLDYVVKMF